MSPQARSAADAFRDLQIEICAALERIDGRGRFGTDAWTRPGGGGGVSRTITGPVIEKGGVGFSAVHGALGEAAARALHATAGPFFATGVSIVLHPSSPHVPIIHMNVRYFERADGQWWFGGGIDLTPHYVDAGLARRFHEGVERVCAGFADVTDYATWRRQADAYFYLPHRGETRGIGGIFYDRLHAAPFERYLAFSIALGRAFAPLWAEQVAAGREVAIEDGHRRWQRLRRGRYVEFNLVWDRGTKFGLETDGRTESVLMSMPPQADWTYDFQPEAGSAEEATLEYLRQYRQERDAVTRA